MNVFDLYAKLTLDTSEYMKGLDSAEKSASGFGGGFGKAAAIIGTAIGAASTAVAGFGATAVHAGMSFDTAMGGVAATMGATVADLEAEVGSVDTSFGHFSGTLREFAMFMGKNTAFSASEAASALNYMALAGYKTQESMEMLPTVLNMAAAGAMDLAQASDMITDTQKAFGLDFQRTSLMVDEFAKAASTGNTSVEQLGEAMLRVGGLGAELNGGMITLADGTEAAVDNVQELEIAFTAMANAGVKGSEAGTHMRNMLLKLASPTDKGAEAFEELGVSVFDADGKMRSLSDIFGELSEAFDGLTQQEKLQAISDIFNTRDTASAEALLRAVGQDWDYIGEQILDAKGSAAEMAATKLDNLAGDMTIFRSAMESAQITISDKLSPSLRDFVQFGTKGVSELTTAFQEGGLTGAIDVFGDLLSDGITMIVEKIPQFIEAGSKLVIALVKGLAKNKNKLLQAARDIVKAITSTFAKEFPNAAKYLNTFQKAVDSLFSFIQNNGPFILATIKGIVAGFLTFKTITTVMGTVAKGIGIVSTAMKVLNGEMVLANALNPYTAIAASVAVLVGAITTLDEIERQEAQAAWDAATKLSQADEERVERAREYVDVLKGVEENNRRILQSTEEQLQPTQDLVDKLREMVEPTGQIKAGYEEQAQIISEQLNDALGTDLEINGNILQNYQEQIAAIETMIERKRAEALIDAGADAYNEAMEKRKGLHDDLIALQDEQKQSQDELYSAQIAYRDLMNDVTGQYANSPRANVFYEQIQEQRAIIEANEEKLRNLDDAIYEVGLEYYKNQEYLEGYSGLMKSTEGTAEDMQAAIQRMNDGLIENAPLEILEQQMLQARQSFTDLIDARKEGLFVSDSEIEEASAKLSDAVKLYEDAGGDVREGFSKGIREKTKNDPVDASEDMAQDTIDAAKTTLDEHSPSKVFLEIGDNLVEGFNQGITEKTPAAVKAVQNMLTQVEGVFKGLSQKAKLWGADMMTGFTAGIMGNMATLTSSMVNMSSTVKSYIHFSEPDKGPLSDFHTYAPDMMKLFAEGIEDNTGIVTSAVSRAFDFKDMMSAPEYTGSSWATSSAPNASSDSATMQKVVDLLQQIVDGGMNVALEGDAADIFNVVARENRISTRATGYNQLSMIGR